MQPAAEITHLLHRWGEGDASALDQLMPLVYERMRQLAHQRRHSEPDVSLNTTALVHEAYLRMVDVQTSVRDRNHFFSLASRVMRHLLVDQARARKAAKRGGGAIAAPLDEAIWIDDADLDVIADLDSALVQLEALHARQARILELRYFGGLSLEETAGALDVSLATVKRELRSARAWLAATLSPESA